jgi:hypothetical protein
VPRIGEADLTVDVLNILAKQPGGFMKTSDLIKKLENQYQPTGEDAAILEGRSDTKFSQIVRNIVSHRRSPNNIVRNGLASYSKARRGLELTQQGQAFLKEKQNGI